MEIQIERRQPLAVEVRQLPADIYNLARGLVARRGAPVFVPIRSMQYLAILDADEFLFIDHQYKNWVDIAWRAFHPQARQALDEPVAYEAVFYQPDGAETMRRLQGEFTKAVAAVAGKEAVHGTATVLPFTAGKTHPADL